MIDPSGHIYPLSGVNTAQAPVFQQKKQAEADAFQKILKSSDAAPAPSPPAKTAAQEGHDGGFFDFVATLVDIINPLQHIPVISTIYRQMTGDELSAPARIVGDTLYGGPVGAALAFANIAAEKTTGKDIGDNVVALMQNNENDNSQKTSLASADDIIWETPAPADESIPHITVSPRHKDFLASTLPMSTLPHRMRMSGKEPEAPSHTHIASSVHQMKDRVSSAALPARTDSLPSVLQSQDAPAADARTALPPELIATKMMEALDKYGAMKKAEYAPKLSSSF